MDIARMVEQIRQYPILFLAACVLFFSFANFLAAAVVTVPYPYDTDYSEGFIAHYIAEAALGSDIYDLGKFNPVKYTPLYFYFASPLTAFLDPLMAGRTVSLFFILGSGLLVFLIVRRQGVFFAAISAFLFFSIHAVFWLSAQVNTNQMALFFSLLGIHLMLTARHRLAAIAFALSIMSNQTYFAAPLASLLYLYIRDKWTAARFLGFFMLSAGLFTILFEVITGGIFLQRLLSNAVGIIKADTPLIYFLLYSNALVLVAAFFQARKNPTDLLSLYFVFALLRLSFILMRVGGWVYYFVELAAICSMMVGLMLKNGKTSRNLLAFLLLVQLSVYTNLDSRIALYSIDIHSYPPLANLEADAKLASYMDSGSFAEHLSYAPAAAQGNIPEAWTMVELVESGKLPAGEAVAAFANYSVIAYYSRLPEIRGLAAYIMDDFELADSIKWLDLASNTRTWSVYRRT